VSSPVGVAVDSSGDVYVVNYGMGTVAKFSATGEVLNARLIEGLSTNPRALAVDSSGNVYVAGVSGTVEYSSSGACVSECKAINPDGNLGVAVDSEGDVLISDRSAGTVDEYGPGEAHPRIENPELEEPLFAEPFGLAVASDAEHTLYVASYGGHSVTLFKQFASPSGPVATTAGATEPSETGVTLNGAVNPGGTTATYQFQYGETEAYGTTVPAPAGELAKLRRPTAVSQAIAGLKASTTYHFRIVATNSQGTSASEDETFQTVGKPTVVTGAATNVSSYGAELNGTVDPYVTDTTYHFEYGLTTGYGASVPFESVDVGSGSSPVAVLQGVGALIPGATYHYRVVAENSHGKTVGSDRTFTTAQLPPGPTASTGVASGVTRTGATLVGTVNPNGGNTIYHFEYGTSAAYGVRAPAADGEAGFGGANVEVSVPVSGLAPGTTYHFRLVAQSLTGGSFGKDATFTTPASPPGAVTGAASGVSQNAATLSGTVETRGQQTIYGFEIGTEAGSYGPAILAGSLGGEASEAVTLDVGELTPGVTYHYRFEAVNQDGVVHGEDQSFTTPVFTNPFSVPTVLPFVATPAVTFPTGSQANTSAPNAKGKPKAKKRRRKKTKKARGKKKK
jgi:hypothetical protein